ncbi:hypothetical protein G6F56_004161 [Rhizopus delemar]|nr:hypothetical protein G6F56_004161 [Rhizopus delemar]
MAPNPYACLLLPIQDIFMHPQQRFKFPSICSQMKVYDLFQYNPQTHMVARIPHADIDNRFKRATNKILRGIAASKLHLSYFFGKLCISDTSRPSQTDISIDENPPQLSFEPFVNCLQFKLSSNKSFTDVTTKIFRKTCNQLNTSP